jgi:hypothetical protein
MNAEKHDKKDFHQPNELLPLPSGLVEAPRKRPFFSKLRVSTCLVAINCYLLYNAHFRGSKQFWQDKGDSYDNYIKGVEEGYL